MLGVTNTGLSPWTSPWTGGLGAGGGEAAEDCGG